MAQASGPDLERILDDALDDFDSSLHVSPGPHAGAHGSNDPGLPITSEGPPKTDATAPATERNRPNKLFNPLGNKPRKRSAQRSAAAEPGQDQLQASLDGLTAVMEEMFKGDMGASTGDMGASGSTESVQSTLHRVNEAARAAAEGSTGQAPGSSPAGPEDGQAEIQQMLDAMSRAMAGDGDEANSFVETLMHGLLSKEVLFDPLKDVADRYPAWMEANRDSLSAEELAQYEAQLAHINRICDLLDAHGDTKFDELLQLLQELQSMGQPPQELLQQMQASTGNAAGLPDDIPQCPIQ